jgi:hypothetical protein
MKTISCYTYEVILMEKLEVMMGTVFAFQAFMLSNSARKKNEIWV